MTGRTMWAVVMLGLLAALAGGKEPGRLPDAPPLPILAWGGPPEDQTTPERYRELAEAGFTHNFSGFGSAAATGKALDVAHGAGVKLLLSLPELTSDPEGTARRFKGHPAIGGYYLRDEPSAADFEKLAQWARRIQAVDSDHPCYINLFPNYATDAQLGTAGYRAHVERFVKEVPVPLISFDHYPVVGETVRPGWYENLEIISAAAGKAGKPFWAFALSTAHAPYPLPTVAHLRLQVYSNLAYGAQGLQYFTYWTSKSDTWDFHDGPIGIDGKRTATYERVREVNQEVQAIRGVFVGSKVLSVGHTGKDLPAGTRRFEPVSPVKSVETEGDGAVVALLERTDMRLLVIVNKSLKAPMRLKIQLSVDANPSRVNKDGTLHRLSDGQLETDVAPGDVAVLYWPWL